jgi:xylulokinase
MLSAPLFDAHALTWSPQAVRAVGLRADQLPRVVRAHDVLGSVTRAAAEVTGLREGTPVIAGGGDFAASALGSGVVEEGQACLMLGTAGNLLMPMREPRFDPRLINSHHVGCDRWLALGGTLCGAALEWFRTACAPGVDWDTLEREAEAAAPAEEGETGPIVLPYFQGERTPVWDASARGALFGLTLGHGRGHLYRAVVEGIALGFRHCLAVAQEAGVRVEQVVAANGAGRSPLLRQTLSDALGLPLRWSSDDGADGAGATVRGAAMLAALGTGLLAEPSAAAYTQGDGRRARPIEHRPDAHAHARLEKAFAQRKALFEATRGVTGSPEA